MSLPVQYAMLNELDLSTQFTIYQFKCHFLANLCDLSLCPRLFTHLQEWDQVGLWRRLQFDL